MTRFATVYNTRGSRIGGEEWMRVPTAYAPTLEGACRHLSDLHASGVLTHEEARTASDHLIAGAAGCEALALALQGARVYNRLMTITRKERKP